MTEYTAAMAHAAVARGAAWLDKRCPQWVSHIDLEVLDLGRPDYCILGQTAVCLVPKAMLKARPGIAYSAVLSRFRINEWGKWSPEHGFDVFDGRNTAAYEMLGIAWKVLIRERLAVSA